MNNRERFPHTTLFLSNAPIRSLLPSIYSNINKIWVLSSCKHHHIPVAKSPSSPARETPRGRITWQWLPNTAVQKGKKSLWREPVVWKHGQPENRDFQEQRHPRKTRCHPGGKGFNHNKLQGEKAMLVGGGILKASGFLSNYLLHFGFIHFSQQQFLCRK